MNIFYTNEKPLNCAKDHTKIHTRKMIVEYAQLLSTSHRVLDGYNKSFILKDHRNDILYKSTHMNHPSAKWVRESKENYLWLYNCLFELCIIYENANNKKHKTSTLLETLKYQPNNIKNDKFVEPYIAINKITYPTVYKEKNTIDIYREYMKLKFIDWKERNIDVSWYSNKKPEWLNDEY